MERLVGEGSRTQGFGVEEWRGFLKLNVKTFGGVAADILPEIQPVPHEILQEAQKRATENGESRVLGSRSAANGYRQLSTI